MNTTQRVIAVAAIGILTAGVAVADHYEIDNAHTKILFKVKHLGISTVTGQFKDFSGFFDVDPDNLSTLKASATIDTASIDTENSDRDNHLRSPDFFDAAKHPEIKFVSTKAKKLSGGELELHGDLTIRGVTKSVVLKGEFGGAINAMGKPRAAFTASGKINRKDFGLTWNRALDTGGLVVGEEVTIVLEVEGFGTTATE